MRLGRNRRCLRCRDAAGDLHALLMIPCGEGDDECGDSAAGPSAVTQNSPASATERPTTATPANPALNGPARHDAGSASFPMGPAVSLSRARSLATGLVAAYLNHAGGETMCFTSKSALGFS
jgi:hypothetical protein